MKNYVVNDEIGTIITADAYYVKEQEMENCSVSYDKDGHDFIITNTYKICQPNTGDNLYFYLTIMAMSLIGIIVISVKKKQTSQK